MQEPIKIIEKTRRTGMTVMAVSTMLFGGLFLSLNSTSFASAPDAVTICHAAGQAGTEKFVTLTLPRTAVYGQAGHFYENGTARAGHEEDYVGSCKTSTPTPSPTPTPTPTPSPSPAVSPSPTPVVEGQSQNQSQTQNNNQTVNITIGGAVAGVKTPTISPETGISVLGLTSMFSAGPVGFVLSKFGRGKIVKGKKENLSKLADDLIKGRGKGV